MTRTWGRRTRATCFALAAFVAIQGGPGGAHADDQEGRRQYRQGEELIKAGDFWGAARAFEAGYAASSRSGFLLNIGNCYRRLGELAKARTHYWRFLELAPKNHSARDEVIALLRTIEQIEADGVPLDEPALGAEASRPALRLAPSAPVAKADVSPALSLGEPTRSSASHDGRSGPGRWWVWALVGSAVAGTAAVFVVNRGGAEAAPCGATLGCVRE